MLRRLSLEQNLPILMRCIPHEEHCAFKGFKGIPCQILLTLCRTLIKVSLQIWKWHLGELKIQNSAARIITEFKCDTLVEPLLNELIIVHSKWSCAFH